MHLGFNTLKRTAESIRRLQHYVFVERSIDPEANRVWRCLNLMSATRMGIRGRIELQGSTPELVQIEAMVADFRERLSTYYSHIHPQFSVPTEEQQLQELVTAFEEDRETFWRVQIDLTRRLRRSKTAGSRPELRKYLELMERAQHYDRGCGRALVDSS